MSLLTFPTSTIFATSTVAASLTRSPLMNSTGSPSRFMYAVISGPPPCTTTGTQADVLQEHHVAREVLAQRRVLHRRPAVLDDHRLAGELPHVRERLQEGSDVPAVHVVYSALIVT